MYPYNIGDLEALYKSAVLIIEAFPMATFYRAYDPDYGPMHYSENDYGQQRAHGVTRSIET